MGIRGEEALETSVSSLRRHNPDQVLRVPEPISAVHIAVHITKLGMLHDIGAVISVSQPLAGRPSKLSNSALPLPIGQDRRKTWRR